jgi:hypothetical protein
MEFQFQPLTNGRKALPSREVRLKLNLHRLKPDGIQGNIASFLRSKLNLPRLKPDGIRMDFSHSALMRWV